MRDDLGPLSLAQIEAAAANGRLFRLAEELVQDEAWSSLERLFSHAGSEAISLEAVAAAVRAVDEALARLPEGRLHRAETRRERATVRALAGRTLARRLRRDPLTSAEANLLSLAAELLFRADEEREAALLFERAGQDARAADAYAALGEIEAMEACHARLEARREARHARGQLQLLIERHVLSGERRRARQILEALPPARLEETNLGETLEALRTRLLRRPSLMLRVPGETSGLRLCAAPAVLGRDPSAELPLRDPGVSRQHARIVATEAGFAIEDLGSRAGTWLAGARIEALLSIGGPVEWRLGEHCRVQVAPSPALTLRLFGLHGLDRSFQALVGTQAIGLDLAFPEARGAVLEFETTGARLTRAATLAVRVERSTIGAGCDLMIGDIIELGGGPAPLRLEVAL